MFYKKYRGRKQQNNSLRVRHIAALFFITFFVQIAFSQSLTEQEAMDLAVKNHPLIQKNQTQILHAKALIPTAKTLAPAEFSAETPQFLMGPDNSTVWTVLGVQQSFLNKKVYQQHEKTLQQQVKVSEAELAVSVQDIRHQARVLYQNCLLTKEKIRYWQEQDSVFQAFNRVAEVEARVGKITPLERLTIESFYKNTAHLLRGAALENQNALLALNQYLKTTQTVINQSFVKLFLEQKDRATLPLQQFYVENERLQTEKQAQQKLATTPSYNVGVNQYLFNRFVAPVVRVGVNVPLWTKGYKAAEQAAMIEIQVAQKERDVVDFQLNTAFQKALNDVASALQNLDFYEKTGLPQAIEILNAAQKTRALGAATTFEYLQSLRQAFELKIGYLMALQGYNEAVLRLDYFKNL